MQKLNLLLFFALSMPIYTEAMACFIGPKNHRRFGNTPSDHCRYLVLVDHVIENMIVGSAQGSIASTRSAERIELENKDIHQCQHRANGPYGRDIACDCYRPGCNWKTEAELYSGEVHVEWVTHLDLD